MASIQPKNVNGKKYWQIVESRRVNGKPRPIVLEHLGTADSLLKKLRQAERVISVKSYSHGLVAAVLQLTQELNVIPIINRHVQAQRKYFADQPVRNGLTVGCTLLFAALGRVCLPTSKRGWYSWAGQSSFSYLMRMNLSGMDSQHFWDMMDSLPETAIPEVEKEIIDNVRKHYRIKTDTLFYDTTNFYTYIATTNKRCDIPQRGKNKQKRADLRQVGLAMVVSRNDFIPLLHHTYQGNMHDAPVFKSIIAVLRKRMTDLGMDLHGHTLVFDRGCNSKENLGTVSSLGMFYVGALTPADHPGLLEEAEGNYSDVTIGENSLQVFRDKREIWGEERTVLLFVSAKLKAGQLRGIYRSIEKKMKLMEELKNRLGNTARTKRTRKAIEEKIDKIINNPKKTGSLINYELRKKRNGPYVLEYGVDAGKMEELEDSLGFRIIMTNRHDWTSEEIIKAYYGQSFIENAFRNIKNPYHLAVTPEFHWTNQKIRIHFFCCVLGYMLTMLVWKKARELTGYKGNVDNLLDMLNGIRLATVIKNAPGKGKPKVEYQLELMNDLEKKMVKALNIENIHKKPLKINGVSVYN